jgi:cell division inhibitor SepF
MAGAMRKVAEYLGLVEHDGRYDEYDEFEAYDGEHPRPARRSVDDERRPTPLRPRLEEAAEVGDVRWMAAGEASEHAYRITTLHPRTYNEARTIGEHFRDGTPVIMNLTDMNDTDAKRLVDFAAGLIFGLRGSIERVTNKVFLLIPANVEVTAEDKRRIAEGGFFNQS